MIWVVVLDDNHGIYHPRLRYLVRLQGSAVLLYAVLYSLTGGDAKKLVWGLPKCADVR